MKTYRTIAGLTPCLLFSLIINCAAQDIESIKPLFSTRKDVEKLVGVTSDPDISTGYYLMKNGTLIVGYSAGKCWENSRNEWDVARDVVIAFSYYPFTFERFKSEDFTDYIRYPTAMRDRYQYKNQSKGKSITTSKDDKNPTIDIIYSFYTFPTEDQKKIKCPPKD